MKLQFISISSFLLICLLVLPAWAVEYRLQVTNLDYRTFSAYEGHLGELEARLDQQKFPPAAVIPGREVHLLEDPAYGGTVPHRLAVLPATRNQAWTTFVWQGHPGDTVAFVVKSDMAAWQEIWWVAADTGSGLRRLSMWGPSLFGRQRPEVPAVSNTFLANAVDQGTFPQWVAQHAPGRDGLSLVVGRGSDIFYRPDRVYVLIKLPPEPRTYKLVIAWRDHSNRGTGGLGDHELVN